MQPFAWAFTKQGCIPQICLSEPSAAARQWFVETGHTEVPLYTVEAFRAGQRDMQERAAEVAKEGYNGTGIGSTPFGIARAIQALPIKDQTDA